MHPIAPALRRPDPSPTYLDIPRHYRPYERYESEWAKGAYWAWEPAEMSNCGISMTTRCGGLRLHLAQTTAKVSEKV